MIMWIHIGSRLPTSAFDRVIIWNGVSAQIGFHLAGGFVDLNGMKIRGVTHWSEINKP